MRQLTTVALLPPPLQQQFTSPISAFSLRSYTKTPFPSDAHSKTISKLQLLDCVRDGVCNTLVEEDNDAVQEGRKVLLDVRSPEEFAVGSIPCARNIPLQQLEDCLTKMTPDEREREYGFDIMKWRRDATEDSDGESDEERAVTQGDEALPKGPEVIVFCQAGLRSRRAQLILEKHGFGNVRNYEGSYNEWSSP